MCQLRANMEYCVGVGIRRDYGKLVRHRFQGSGTLKDGSLRKARFGKKFKKRKRITRDLNSMVKGKEMGRK